MKSNFLSFTVYALKIFGIERGNKKPRKDIAKWSDVKNEISYMYDEKFYAQNVNYVTNANTIINESW